MPIPSDRTAKRPAFAEPSRIGERSALLRRLVEKAEAKADNECGARRCACPGSVHQGTEVRTPKAGDTPAAARPREGSRLILVVDDEAIMRALARRILERSGYCAILAESGEEALALLEQSGGEVRLVLLDLTMPRMDGLATLQALRKLDAQVPVLLSSGLPEEEVAERFQGERVAGFLQKPFGIDELRDAVEAIFRNERSVRVA